MRPDFIAHVQTFTARSSVTASATRGQGAPGIAVCARDHLSTVPLRDFSVQSHAAFERVLDRETRRLAAAIPELGRSWGLSRKLLNIFLRNALYTVYLRDEFDLARAEPWFEVPLDSVVADRDSREPEGESLPDWPGVKHLTVAQSAAFQDVFCAVARRLSVSPVHLDAWYWGGDRGPAA